MKKIICSFLCSIIILSSSVPCYANNSNGIVQKFINSVEQEIDVWNNFLGDDGHSDWEDMDWFDRFNWSVDSWAKFLHGLPDTNNYNSVQDSYNTTNNNIDYNYYSYTGGTTSNYNVCYDNSINYYDQSNTFNTVTYNDINNVYYNTEYNTYMFETTNNYYSFNNYITYQTVSVCSKQSPNEVSTYIICYELPSGENSYNLTKEDIVGVYFTYDSYNYTWSTNEPNLLGLWHFDGNFVNSAHNSDVYITYGGNNFVNGKFGSGIETSSIADILRVYCNDYNLNQGFTLECWFYNRINNDEYHGCGDPQTWIHCLWEYNGSDMYVWFNGEQKPFNMHFNIQNLNFDVDWDDYTFAPYTHFYDTYAKNMYWEIPYRNKNGVILGNQIISSNKLPNYDFNPDVTTSSDSLVLKRRPFTVPSYTEYNPFVINNYTVAPFTDSILKDGYTFLPIRYPSSWFANANGGVLHSDPSFTQHQIMFCYTSSSGNAYQFNHIDIGTVGVQSSEEHVNTNNNLQLNNYTIYPNDYIPITFTKTQGYQKIVSNKDFADLSHCIIDEMRLYKGVRYNVNNDTIPVPTDPFTESGIWTIPNDNGDNLPSKFSLAFQTNIPVTNVRIGGSEYGFAEIGSVYIALNDDKGQYAKIWDGSTWIYIGASVYNGNYWVPITDFNFRQMQFSAEDYESVTGNTYITNNYYNYNDVSGSDIIGTGVNSNGLSSFFTFIVDLFVLMFPIVPLWVKGLIILLFNSLVALLVYKGVKK